MAISVLSAAVFLPFALAILVITFYVDLKYKRISNSTVVALFLVFAVIGPFVLPFVDYLWRFAHLGIVLGLGLVMYATRQVGAGDVKFAAAMAPFVHGGDVVAVMFIAAAAMLATLVTNLLATATGLYRLAPDWAAWKYRSDEYAANVGIGKQRTIPFGTGLALTLVAYLLLGVVYGQSG